MEENYLKKKKPESRKLKRNKKQVAKEINKKTLQKKEMEQGKSKSIEIDQQLFSILKNQSIQKRIDFLENYCPSYNIEERLFLIDKIESDIHHRNKEYVIELVETASRMTHGGTMVRKIFPLLNKSDSNYYLQLTVLDYLLQVRSALSESDKNYIAKALLDSVDNIRRRRIVRNQFYLCMILFETKIEKMKIIRVFRRSFQKTDDYRSHIRTYNTLLDHNSLVIFFGKIFILEFLFKTSFKKEFGRGVISKIEELEKII